MKNHKVTWWLSAIVILIIAVAGGILVGRQMSPAKPTTTTKMTKSKQPKQRPRTTKRAASSVSRNATNNLTVSDLGAGTMAMAIIDYASHHLPNDGVHSWQAMNQDYRKNLGTVIISKEYVQRLNKPGTGVAYYVVPRGSDADGTDLAVFPSYTLEKDKTIHLYQPGRPNKAVATVSLATVVADVNQARRADKVREVGQAMSIVQRNDAGQDGDPNHISTDDLKTPQMTDKVVLAFGMARDTNHFWQDLKRYIARQNVTLALAPLEDVQGTMVAANSTEQGCTIYYEAANVASGRPDMYNFGHYIDGSHTNNDIAGGLKDLGFTMNEMLRYVNAHGGKSALTNIHIKSGTYIQ